MMEKQDVRAMVARMREDAGIARTEIERAIGYRKDSLRDFELRTGPLYERDKATLLKYLWALCMLTTGHDYRGRMKRLRKALGISELEAAKQLGFRRAENWRKIERENKAALLKPTTRVRLDALLTRWQSQLDALPEAAE